MLEEKLEALENVLSNVKKAADVTVQKHVKLDADDLAAITRRYMDIKVVVKDDMVDWEPTIDNLTSSKSWENILRPYTVLLSHPGLYYSSYHSVTQVKQPRFASATSLFMLGAKHSQKIPYMYWKRGLNPTDWPYIFNYSTAEALACGVTIQQWNACVPNSSLYQEVLKDPTNPLDHQLKRPENILEHNEDEDPRYRWQEFKTWPKFIRHMKLQTWIFHPSVRDTDSMVLHPVNWDYIPEPSSNTPSVVHSPKRPEVGGGLLGKYLDKKPGGPNKMLNRLIKQSEPQDDLV